MQTVSADILVIGASVASGALIAQMRADGYAGKVVVVDRDPDAPYDRPPLSKEFLTDTALRPQAPWWQAGCELVRGRATGIDLASSTVYVDAAGGATCAFNAGHIVVATGSASIRLPGEPEGVAHLRTAADARRLRQAAAPGRRVIILGAGTIGTELASSLVGAGCAVTLLDQADRPLDRFLAGHLGDAASQWIRQADVDLRLRTKVEGISRKRDSWTVAADSGPIEADLVVSALGARPVIGWLAGSGLDLLNGVRCNSHGTALDEAGRPVANVHAIGDVSAWARAKGGWRRFEDWTTAQRQGRHLARCLTGQCPVAPVDHEPAYFWTHQFGRRIQVLGTPERDARLVQNIDDPDREAAFYTLDGDRGPVAWIAVNSPREFALATRQLSAAPR